MILDNTQKVSFHCPMDLLDKINKTEIAKKQGRSEFIREALKEKICKLY